MEFDLSKDFSPSMLPLTSGVYLFRDEAHKVLYVGKAKTLKNRVRNYFMPAEKLAARTALMLSHARYLQIISTDTEKEALILEASLIKKHRPRFNVLMRDDKAYPFIRLGGKGPFPRLSVVRKRHRDSAIYFGPYPSSKALRETLKIACKAFGLRTCSNITMKSRGRPCLRYQIGMCCGPCTGDVDPEDYAQRVTGVKALLGGQVDWLLKELRSKMEEAAAALEFEKAAAFRDQIMAVEKIIEQTCVVCNSDETFDVFGVAKQGEVAVTVRLKIRDGLIQGQDTREFLQADQADQNEILSFTMYNIYTEEPAPQQIFVPFSPCDQDMLKALLSDSSSKITRFIVPKRGIKARILAMARKNADQLLTRLVERNISWSSLSSRIMKLCRLETRPNHIEAVDISNTGDEKPVGSLICFIEGHPEQSCYRHYNIKTKGQDDFAMIYEVIRRRVSSGEDRNDLPDLFLIDGGKGQLSMAMKALKEKNIKNIGLISIAKDRGDKQEKLYIPQKDAPILLPRHDRTLLFFQRMRDEAHRFGISFHRRKRDKSRLISVLTGINGIGPARQVMLLRYFGSVANIKKASVDELRQAGLPYNVAQNLFSYFRTDSRDELIKQS